MVYPDIEPTKIDIQFPQYNRTSEEYDTSDYHAIPIATIGLGLSLTLSYNPIVQQQVDELRDFYNFTQRRKRFTLPAPISNCLPTEIMNILTKAKATWWTIDSPWNLSPLFINDACNLYSLIIKIKSL